MGREFEQKEEFRLLPNICKTKFLFMKEENMISIIRMIMYILVILSNDVPRIIQKN